MRYLHSLCATALLVHAAGLATACADPAGDAEGGQTAASDLEREAPPVLTFDAEWGARLTGSLRAGSTVRVVYAEARAGECRGSQGGRPQFATTGHAQLEGAAPLSFWAAGNTSSDSERAEFTLPMGPGGDLAVWFETTSRWGCHAWDSALGANYHFDVRETRHRPDWIGAASVVIARATCDAGPCDADRRDLAAGFTLDTWARERAAIRRVDFRVYEPSLTDQDDSGLWEKLDAQVHYRFGGAGDFQHRYVDFDRRVGNDARYALQLSSLDPLAVRGTLGDRSECPEAPLTASVDGQTVSTTMDFYFTVQGAELRPDAGGTFTGTYANYASLFAICTQP